MNNIIKSLCAVMFFAATFLQAQKDTLLSYYPMSTGNMWQYKLTHYRYSSPVVEQYYSVTIQGDTTINGKMYHIFTSTLSSNTYRGIYPTFQRIDTSAMIVYGYDTSGTGEEYVMDSLLAGRGSPRYRFIDDHYPARDLTYRSQLQFGALRNVRVLSSYWVVMESVVYTEIIECRDLGITWCESGNDGGDWIFTKYWFRDSLVFAKIDNKEYGAIVSVHNTPQISMKYELHQNYPNPCNPMTTIQFDIPKSEFVQLKVYDLQGRIIAQLVDAYVSAGSHRVVFNALNYSSGLYFYQLITKDFRSTKKMMLLK